MDNVEWKRHLYGELIVFQQEAFANGELRLADGLTKLASNVEADLNGECKTVIEVDEKGIVQYFRDEPKKDYLPCPTCSPGQYQFNCSSCGASYALCRSTLVPTVYEMCVCRECGHDHRPKGKINATD